MVQGAQRTKNQSIPSNSIPNHVFPLTTAITLAKHRFPPPPLHSLLHSPPLRIHLPQARAGSHWHPLLPPPSPHPIFHNQPLRRSPYKPRRVSLSLTRPSAKRRLWRPRSGRSLSSRP